MPLRRSLAAVFCLTLMAGAAVPAPAAETVPPLSDRIPSDALIYLGWTGADACPGYDGSHLKAVVDRSSIPQVFSTFVPQLIRKVTRMDREAGAAVDQLFSAAGPMWHHPTAFYFGGLEYPPHGHPVARVALLCDAGDDAADLEVQLKSLLANLPRDADPRPTVESAGGLVVLSLFTPEQVTATFGQPAAEPLSRSVNFVTALAQCHPAGAATVGYVDLQAIVAAIDAGVEHGGNEQATQAWPKIRQTLGLAGLRRVAMTAGFDKGEWMEREFASTDGSQTGLPALMAARPLDADLLTVVPRTADRVSALRADLGGGFDALRGAVAQFDPDAAQKVDDAIKQVDDAAGINVRRDLLGSLGDQWVAYSDRTVGGSGVLGSVLVNHLRDPARADEALTQVSRRLNFIIEKQLDNPNVQIQFREDVVNGTTLHYLAVPLITPTWAIKNGNLYVGLYPQVVTAALDVAAKGGPTFAQRPEFVALQHRLGDHPAATVSFTDLPALAPDSYGELLAGTRLYLGLGDIFGAHAPVLVVPPLKQVMPELSPSGSVTWSDASGWHSASVSPFPGAEVLSSGGAGAASVFQASMLMGAMGQVFEQSRLMR